jgi:site-specific DNA-methyltransferase (adenine-specific)/adenine-specific DNA-methyltransferase
MRYELFGIAPTKGQWIWEEKKAREAVENYKRYLKEANGRTLLEYWLDTGKKYRFIRQDEEGKPQSWRSPAIQQLADTLWLNLMSYENQKIYPTQKHEQLLDRIIRSFSSPGDLVMDCFAGSGTTLAVAEKLGRRWIGVDCGKLAIYTMQKRLLNIAESKDLENPKKKYSKPCKPFTLYNAGLYDYKMIKELPWEQYRDFALKLFQCRDSRHEISKIELDGYLGADSFMVFNYQKHPNAVLDRGFIDDLHKHLGDKIGRRFFIIAPAASVRFLEDYIEKGKTKYFLLRIPYSIIEEIHNRGFSKIKQPINEMDVNDTVDAVGFDFIQVPTVECKYLLDKPKKADLFNQNTKECVIKIERFESKVISRKPLEFANLETLSMVMLDYDFDGEVFDLDEVFYAEDLKKNGYEVRFAEDKVKEQIMIIYIDIFGNEKREIKTLSDFNGKKKK